MILDAAEAHRETGDIKNTAQEGGGETIQLSERDEEEFKPFSDKINDVVSKAIDGEGRIDGKNKTIPIIPVGPKLVAMVSASSKNSISMNERMLAINPGITWHEYRRHTKVSDEISRNQIAFTKRQFLNAIKAIVSPDMVECLFTDPANPTQQQSFAVVKRTNRGRYIVVEAVGGNQNQTIYPVMILQFTHSKWNNMMKQGLTLGEILYSDNQKKLAALDVAQNKNSRVTAAKFASLAAFATDDSTSYPPHSPRLKDNISQLDAESNPSGEINSGKRSERSWQMDPSRDYLAEAQEELFGKEFLKALEAPWKSSKAGEAFDALIDDRNSRERAREEWFHGTAQDAFDALMDKRNRSEGAEPERLDESAQEWLDESAQEWLDESAQDYGGDVQEAAGAAERAARYRQSDRQKRQRGSSPCCHFALHMKLRGASAGAQSTKRSSSSGVSAICSAPARCSCSRVRKPQVTQTQSIPVFRAVCRSTSVSPT